MKISKHWRTWIDVFFTFKHMFWKKESSSKNHNGKMNAQILDVDACHAVASYHDATLDNRVTAKVVVVRKVKQVEDSQQTPSDRHCDSHSDAQDPVLLTNEKVKFQAVPSQ